MLRTGLTLLVACLLGFLIGSLTNAIIPGFWPGLIASMITGGVWGLYADRIWTKLGFE